MSLWIKVCGLKTPAAAQAAARAGADAVGLVFAPSRRQVTSGEAQGLVRYLSPAVEKVGVFVNSPGEEVEAIARRVGLDWLQFHGDEGPQYCSSFRRQWKVIKAFAPRHEDWFQELDRYQVDAFLVDTYCRGARGGTGRTFNWNLVSNLKLSQPLILAGGLHQENVAQALTAVKPAGVDVSTGVEKEGEKDPNLITSFIKTVRRWEDGTGN